MKRNKENEDTNFNTRSKNQFDCFKLGHTNSHLIGWETLSEILNVGKN